MRALIAYVRSGEPDLTNRQMALLMLVYLTPGPHTVRGLAESARCFEAGRHARLEYAWARSAICAASAIRTTAAMSSSSAPATGPNFLEGFKRNLRRRATGSPPAHRPVIGQQAARLRTPADGSSRWPALEPARSRSINAYRSDLADVALAGRVIASHYAEPLLRHLVAQRACCALRRPTMPKSSRELEPGDDIRLLDDTRGWAWGYAGPDRRVGYVRAEALGL